MEGSDGFERFVRGGLEQLGIEPDEVDIAVMTAVDGVWGSATRELMAADLSEIDPESDPDLSSPPR